MTGTDATEGATGQRAGDVARLEALEARAADLAATAESLGARAAAAPLAALEQDLIELACDAPELGAVEGARHPVVDVALAWEERLGRGGGCDPEAAAVGAFAAAQLARDLELRAEELTALGGAEPAAPTPAVVFEALAEVEELARRMEGRADRLDEDSAVLAPVLRTCERVGAALRGLLEARIAASAPSLQLRGLWADRLVDLADEARLEASEVRDRARAARILERARLALRWHLRAVEAGKGANDAASELTRRLSRRERRLRAERIEADLEARLVRRFGAGFVRAWERAILLSLVVVLALLAVSFVHGNAGWIIALDTGVCALFLVDFLVKASFVRFHPLWLRRHVLTDFVPALPFGLLGGIDVAAEGSSRWVRLLRFLRVVPLLRLLRAFSFLMRSLDRLVARHARELDTKVLVFPSPSERRRRVAPADDDAPSTRYWRLRADVDALHANLLESADAGAASALAVARLGALEAGAATHPTRAAAGSRSAARAAARLDRTPLAEDLLAHMGAVQGEELEGRLGTEAIGRIARAARLISRSPLRFAPVLGACVPSEAADLPDRRVASRTMRRISRRLASLHEGVLWWADLKGSLTPGELVGRIGSALVARTSRPAIRLLLVATAYVALQIALTLLGVDTDEVDGGSGGDSFVVTIWQALEKLVSSVLVILGSLCLVLLGVGVWLQRLARDTTVFLERIARAQFLHLTDSIKARFRDEDAALVGERVFRLERALQAGEDGANGAMADATRFARELGAFAAEGVSPPAREGGEFDPIARAVMLYRDLLDGALLARSDARVTGQLLGNLAVRRILTQSGRVGPREVKALRRLDLERRNTIVSGPYLWFHAITRALSSRAARLIVEYNAHAIPLAELDRVGAAESSRYERWVARRGAVGEGADGEEGEPDGAAPELTTAFTMMHFLDDAPARDAEVAARFGDEVLRRLRADRRALVRTVFGTYPLHELPREARMVSPKELYDEWVAGGRVLLVPVRAALAALRLSRRGLQALVDAVRSIRDPHRAEAIALDVEADFTAAARKIDRMRGPAALTALRLRATLDPEYVGLDLPLGLASDRSDAEERRRSAARRDAAFLGATPVCLEVLAALEQRAARTVAHIERLARGGLVGRIESRLGLQVADDPAALRALVILIQGDIGGIRSALLGREVFREAVSDGLEYGLPDVPRIPPVALWWRFRRRWANGLGAELVRHCRRAGLVGEDDGAERRVRAAAWRALRADVDGSRAAFEATLDPEASARAGEGLLAEALRHPARVTEQLVTLRVVQTLTLIDVRNYRRHVWSLGAYAGDGDTAGDLIGLQV